MSLVFYHVPMSTSSVTEGVLAELGVPCERVILSIQGGDTAAPTFLALNPNGRVPVIVHDGTPIWESAAITLYLGELFGMQAGLYPPPGPKRGEAMKWVVWSNTALAEAAGRMSASLPADSDGGVVAGSRDWIAPEQRSASAADKARRDVQACLKVLDGALAHRPFLIGEYSLADTHVQGFVGWIGSMDVNLEPFPSVSAWMERCSARPALAALYAT